MTGQQEGVSTDECPKCSQLFLQADVKANRCTVVDVRLEKEILCGYLQRAFPIRKGIKVESDNTIG